MISASTLLEAVNLKIDRPGSPYFEPPEISIALNMAQMSILKELIYDEAEQREMGYNSPKAAEQNAPLSRYLQPLMRIGIGATGAAPFILNTPGRLLYSEVAAAYLQEFGVASEPFYPLNFWLFSKGDWRFVNWVRHGELGFNTNNAFREPTACYPIYLVNNFKDGTGDNYGLQIYPNDLRVPYRIDYVAKPTQIDIDGDVGSDFDESMLTKLVDRAVEFLSQGMRDAELSQMVQGDNRINTN
jgi:hypothetical protein